MTNEEALNLLQHKLDLAVDDALIMTDKEYEVFSLCVKALEKEDILDKIRAKIEFKTRIVLKGTPSYNSIKTELKSYEDCISRQAVINAIANTCFWLSADNWEELTKCINSISSTTPHPKMGRWIQVDDKKCKCSECDVIHFIAMYPFGHKNYCPNCGARMESEDKE